MKPIDESGINHLFHHILSTLYHIQPADQWSVTPKNWCLTTAKTKYGMVDHQGIIHINQNFLATGFWDLLEAVLRHEFAHLCVGLSQGHNRRFKQCEKLFKGYFNADARRQATAYGSRIHYNYRLMAELVDGQCLEIKKTHRKHHKYTNYPHQNRVTYFYQQQRIKRFYYVSEK